MSLGLPGAPLGHGLAPEVLLNSHATVDLRKCFYARTVALGLSPWDCHLGIKNISKATTFQNKLQKYIQEKIAL